MLLISYWLLLLIPISLGLSYLLHASPVWIFLSSVIAIVPLAVWIRRSTEQIAYKAGPSIGGLLNVTFGNATDLILALFVLMIGQQSVVKGQITGSIIGNGLLGLGIAIIAGSWKREQQTFNHERTSQLSTLLILTVIGLLLPALFNITEHGLTQPANARKLDEQVSLWVSMVLILLYIANLIYTLYTHRDIFKSDEQDQNKKAEWPLWKSILILLVATAAIALEADLVSNALEATAGQLGVSSFFLGITILAIVGNLAEYVSALYFARQDQMNMVMSITVGSTIQVALLVAPLLVLISFLLHKPMDLVFANPLELIAIAGAAFVVNAISRDGKTNWFEGVLLVGVYVLLAIAFFFATPPGA